MQPVSLLRGSMRLGDCERKGSSACRRCQRQALAAAAWVLADVHQRQLLSEEQLPPRNTPALHSPSTHHHFSSALGDRSLREGGSGLCPSGSNRCQGSSNQSITARLRSRGMRHSSAASGFQRQAIGRSCGADMLYSPNISIALLPSGE